MRTTNEPLRTALPTLLSENGLSHRALASKVGVNQSYVSRVLKGEVAASGDFAGHVAEALGLPVDYFPDYREAKVVEAVKIDPSLRDRIYRTVVRSGQGRHRR